MFSAGLLTSDRRRHERKKPGQPRARKKATWWVEWVFVSVCTETVYSQVVYMACLSHFVGVKHFQPTVKGGLW